MIVEFSGLPKSGKSSTIGILRDYLLRNGYEVQVFAEGARMCPFSNRNRVEIAAWTANQALNFVLESKFAGKDPTVFIQDRGLFDSLAFFKLLHYEKRISSNDLDNFLNYFAQKKWTQYVDFVFLLGVKPHTVIERDLAAKLSKLPGVITNLPTLDQLQLAYDFVINNFEGIFPKIIQLHTTDAGISEITRSVIKTIRHKL